MDMVITVCVCVCTRVREREREHICINQITVSIINAVSMLYLRTKVPIHYRDRTREIITATTNTYVSEKTQVTTLRIFNEAFLVVLIRAVSEINRIFNVI